jgi:hypothetical protein
MWWGHERRHENSSFGVTRGYTPGDAVRANYSDLCTWIKLHLAVKEWWFRRIEANPTSGRPSRSVCGPHGKSDFPFGLERARQHGCLGFSIHERLCVRTNFQENVWPPALHEAARPWGLPWRMGGWYRVRCMRMPEEIVRPPRVGRQGPFCFVCFVPST